jgi:hypothetical protein
MIDMDDLAGDVCGLCCTGDGTKGFLGMLLHAFFVLSRRILEHLRVGREHMERRQDRQRGGFGTGALRQSDAVSDRFPGEFRSVSRNQEAFIHRPVFGLWFRAPARSGSHFARFSRIFSSSAWRFALVLG